MPGFKPLVMAAAMLITSCRAASPATGCGPLQNCLATPHGIVLGRDPAARVVAARELRAAAEAYHAWLGQDAPPGLVILDARAKSDVGRVGGTAWTLTYDLIGDAAMSASAAPAKAAGEGPLTVSRSNADFDITRPGVLAHEICHRHASFAFDQAWRGQRRLPDMLDEVTAIACETSASKLQRVRLFAAGFDKGEVIPWSGFLSAAHPLKGNADIAKMLDSLRDGDKKTVTFDIRPGSRYERQIALFYSQAAAFAWFLETGGCKGQAAIGRLLMTYDPEAGFDSWLQANGREFCLPTTSTGLDRSFSGLVAKRHDLSADGRVGAP